MAARRATRHYDRYLAPAGIGVAQFGLLMAISTRDGLNVTELATLLEMDRTTLTRNLRPVCRAGFVRLGSAADRRARAVHLTQEGAAVLKTARPFWRDAQASVRANIGSADLAHLHDLLKLTIEKLPER